MLYLQETTHPLLNSTGGFVGINIPFAENNYLSP